MQVSGGKWGRGRSYSEGSTVGRYPQGLELGAIITKHATIGVLNMKVMQMRQWWVLCFHAEGSSWDKYAQRKCLLTWMERACPPLLFCSAHCLLVLGLVLSKALPTWFPWKSRLLIWGPSASPVGNEICVSLLTLLKRPEGGLQVLILIFCLCFITPKKIHLKVCGMWAQMGLDLNSTIVFTTVGFW